MTTPKASRPVEPPTGSAGEVFRVFLGLGLTSFGGPVAHLGFFHQAFVVRRGWIGERAYGDLVALCQFLPGPASSQVGMAIGLQRAGYLGMLAAWAGFTLPSTIALVLFAYGAGHLGGEASAWIAGLKAAAAAVVAQAVLGMARSLCPDKERAAIAALAMVVALLVPAAFGQVGAIAAGGALGLVWLRSPADLPWNGEDRLSVRVGRGVAISCLAVFLALLVGLPLLSAAFPGGVLSVVDGFYRAGALVFGGGHVLLPLLEAEMVETGRIGREAFLAGYGAAQAVPGPLFTFAAYLGAAATMAPNGMFGAIVALLSIFAPSALLVLGALPFWDALRGHQTARRAMLGVNAAVVGLLAAALYDPVFTSGVTSPATMAITAVAFVALVAWKAPAWSVVIAAAVAGSLLL